MTDRDVRLRALLVQARIHAEVGRSWSAIDCIKQAIALLDAEPAPAEPDVEALIAETAKRVVRVCHDYNFHCDEDLERVAGNLLRPIFATQGPTAGGREATTRPSPERPSLTREQAREIAEFMRCQLGSAPGQYVSFNETTCTLLSALDAIAAGPATGEEP